MTFNDIIEDKEPRWVAISKIILTPSFEETLKDPLKKTWHVAALNTFLHIGVRFET